MKKVILQKEEPLGVIVQKKIDSDNNKEIKEAKREGFRIVGRTRE